MSGRGLFGGLIKGSQSSNSSLSLSNRPAAAANQQQRTAAAAAAAAATTAAESPRTAASADSSNKSPSGDGAPLTSPRGNAPTPVSLDKEEEVTQTRAFFKRMKILTKELCDHQSGVCKSEASFSSALRGFADTSVSETDQSRDLKLFAVEFADKLKKVSSLLQQVGDILDADFSDQLVDLYNDQKLKEAKSKSVLGAEIDFQLAKRDHLFVESLRTVAFSYLCYFETGAAIMRSLEPRIKQLEQRTHPMLDRQEFYDRAIQERVHNLQAQAQMQAQAAKAQMLAELQERAAKDMIAASATTSSTTGGGGGDASPNAATCVFGTPLQTILSRKEEPGPIPVVLHRLFSFVEQHSMVQEGLFRIPGHTADMKRIRELIDAGARIDFEHEPIVNKDHSICGLIKMFFRELPEPLLTYEMFDQLCLMAKMTGDPAAQKATLKGIIDKIPRENYCLLGRLMQLLHKVVLNREYTKMGSQNIAIAFAMNIMKPRNSDNDPILLAMSTAFINRTCQLLIDYCDDFFAPNVGLLDDPAVREMLVLQMSPETPADDAGSSSGSASQAPQVPTIQAESPTAEENASQASEAAAATALAEKNSGSIVPLHQKAGSTLGRIERSERSRRHSGILRPIVISEPVKAAAPASSSPLTKQDEEEVMKGWLECFDESVSRPYWFNSETGETSWLHPVQRANLKKKRRNSQLRQEDPMTSPR